MQGRSVPGPTSPQAPLRQGLRRAAAGAGPELKLQHWYGELREASAGWGGGVVGGVVWEARRRPCLGACCAECALSFASLP